MEHKPIIINELELFFPHKICFEGFNVTIHSGDRIAIIGRNGSGKSTLLKILQGLVIATEGEVTLPSDAVIGYVPQIVEDFSHFSGGERLNEALTQALSKSPNILLLDEPTNHLDSRNRKSLMRMLQSYQGTLIVVSHDTELLRQCIDTLWSISDGKITIFSGNYDDFMRETRSSRASLEQKIVHLERQKKETHNALMKEQKRASKSKEKGKKSIEQQKWPTIVSHAKAGNAAKTTGRKKAAVESKKQALATELNGLRLPEVVLPKFSITPSKLGNKLLISVNSGSVSYQAERPIVREITLSLYAKQRIAITGDNGSGKSTVIAALLGDEQVIREGEWYTPKRDNIGYLDQHYATLDPDKTVLESLGSLVPDWSCVEIRRHLNDFLFRKNEEVDASCASLSGGERARLSFAQIAAKTPYLLILDEITNNLDLETREHIIFILKAYPGAMIVISHDSDFLTEVGIEDTYHITERCFSQLL